jgi:hypothetical protein
MERLLDDIYEKENMKANIAVHLDQEDKVASVSVQNNLGVVQYHVRFESGYSILIDAEIFNSILIRIPMSKEKKS